ncbi:MAG: hypothetical protein ACOYM3_34980 [Terrimicrobiaceae bacterium]
MDLLSATIHPAGHVSPTGDFGWACFAAREPQTFLNSRGVVFGGTYAEASAWMTGQLPQARAFVVIFSRGEGMEVFLAGLSPAVASVPLSGGAAARASGPGFTHPTAEDVAVLAITEGEWQAVSVTAHFPKGEAFRLLGDDPRRFPAIMTREATVGAGDFLRKARAAFGLAANDWDRLAFVTEEGIVLHLHEDGETVVSGADLPESREVKLALFDPDRGRAAILAQARPDALAFGCAGLFGLFGEERPWEALMPTTYLFGEIANTNGIPRFANLTFSLLIPRP